MSKTKRYMRPEEVEIQLTEMRKGLFLRPPSKNGHKKASKNEMNRSISLIYENQLHLFHGLLDNRPLSA